MVVGARFTYMEYEGNGFGKCGPRKRGAVAGWELTHMEKEGISFRKSDLNKKKEREKKWSLNRGFM